MLSNFVFIRLIFKKYGFRNRQQTDATICRKLVVLPALLELRVLLLGRVLLLRLDHALASMVRSWRWRILSEALLLDLSSHGQKDDGQLVAQGEVLVLESDNNQLVGAVYEQLLPCPPDPDNTKLVLPVVLTH